MAKSSRSTSSRAPSSKNPSAKSAKPSQKLDVAPAEESLPPEKKKRPSGRVSGKKSSHKSRKVAPSKPLKKNLNLNRDDILEERQKTTNKRIIIAASVLVFGLLAFMFGGNFIDNQRVEAVKKLNMEQEKNINEYFTVESIISVAKSGQAAVRKLNKVLDAEITNNGPITTINNLIAGLANTYRMNPKITSGYDTILLLKKIIAKTDGEVNRKFALNSLGFIPGGKAELENVIKSKDTNSETSLMALNSLPKTTNGKFNTDVLVYALEKDDVDFLKKIFPLVNDNIDMFKEQVNAVKVLLKISGNLDEDVSRSAFELLSKCIYKPEHYEILKNYALSENARIRDNALNSLLSSPPDQSANALASVLALSNDQASKIKILEKLGTPESSAFFEAILPSLRSNEKEIVIAGLNALGKQKNTPEKGLKEVLACLSNENNEIKSAAAIAIRGYELRKPFFYTETPEQIPSYSLIKLIDTTDENLKTEVIKTLEKISGGEKQLASSTSDWKAWFAKEKSVLDMLIEVERIRKVVQDKFKKTQFKDAKDEYKKMDLIFSTILNDHSKKWDGFDKYLEKKANDFLLLRMSVNKASPID